MRITSSFSEDYQLSDRRTVQLRVIRPDDKEAFIEGLNRCSQKTLYNRFLGPKPSFSTSDLRYLTEFNLSEHVALGAFDDDSMIAVVRGVPYRDRPSAADLGLIVADEYHRQGLGKYLIGLLLLGMAERGIAVLCGEMFASNTPMFHLIDELPFEVEWVFEGVTVSFEIDLTSPVG